MSRTLRAHRCRMHDDQAGISLIEMLVSLVILGVLMSAFAGSLIKMVQTTSRNEEDVRATAAAQEVTESLLVADWDNAILYDEEVATADLRWKARTTVDGSGNVLFEGNELVTQPRPDFARDPLAASPVDVPPPTTSLVRGGTTFNVDRYVIWVQRVNPNDTRRFVTIISWTDRFGALREVRYEAERVPSPEEAAATIDGLRILYYAADPNPVDLGTASTPIDPDSNAPQDIVIRLKTNKPLAAATVTYQYLEITDDGIDPPTYAVATHDISLSHDPASTASTTDPDTGSSYVGFTSWSGTIESPMASGNPNTFYNGTSTFVVDGDNACTPCDDIEGAVFVTFRNGPHDDPGAPNPDPTVTPTGPYVPLTLTLPTSPQFCVEKNTGRLQAPKTFATTVTGLDATTPELDGVMTVSYEHRTGHKWNKPNDHSTTRSTTSGSYNTSTGKWDITMTSADGPWHWNAQTPNGRYDFDVTITRSSDGTTDQKTMAVTVTQC